jgi:CRISPR-associated endonuclease/helicase Cas3
MTVEDFRPFYNAIHGYPPFDWQEQLLRRVGTGGWPGTIALPTSSGKTSAIDIAVFHLALQAGLKMQQRSAAVRTFFVIDRRVVVDEAALHATKIANALLDPKDEILAEARRLLLSYGGELPLEVSTMRGGMYRDNSWADQPNQPLVCVSTVDQTGSRLLFRGYQVGDSSRPVHAGLIGSDSLIIVDEAHLSTAFLDTLAAIRDRYITWAEINRTNDTPLITPFRLVEMSATIHNADTFELEEVSIEKDPLLAARLRASKPAELRVPTKKFEDEMIAAAKELATNPGVRVVGIIANTVGSARAIFTEIKKAKGLDAVLLIGRNRPYCTGKLWEQYKPRIEATKDREPGERLFVVATQTVEVGANIDFDALVTESAPLDSLRQRFGRLNRLGRWSGSKAVIVLRPKDDVVYGAPTANTWKFLREQAPVDFGVAAMESLLKGLDLVDMNSASPLGPLLFPAQLESWVQTNPTPAPDPDVAPFLHGDQALEAADVQVVWREDLSGVEPWGWKQLVALAPPLTSEALALPIAAVRRWLKNQQQEIADIEGVVATESKEEKRDPGRPALRWRGPAKSGPVYASEIRPGDTLVVPTRYNGADIYGWNPDFSETSDIGDEANKAEAILGLRRPRVRVDLAKDIDREELQSLINRLRGIADTDPDLSARDEIAKMFPFKGTPKVDSTGKVITWPLQKQTKVKRPDTQATEETDEDDESSFIGNKVSIADHTKGVEKRARTYAEGCGLTAALVEDIVLAAHLHDLGKYDERFQSWLYGRHFGGRDAYIAKSGEFRTRADNLRLQRDASYPVGARHESGSVMAACTLGLLNGAHDRDLVIFLIGTHHGNGRPLFPVWEEDSSYRFRVESDGVSGEITSGSELARIDSGWIDRFWNLNRKYGYWGLAYLEGILRRADCMQSRWEESHGAN